MLPFIFQLMIGLCHNHFYVRFRQKTKCKNNFSIFFATNIFCLSVLWKGIYKHSWHILTYLVFFAWGNYSNSFWLVLSNTSWFLLYDILCMCSLHFLSTEMSKKQHHLLSLPFIQPCACGICKKEDKKYMTFKKRPTSSSQRPCPST